MAHHAGQIATGLAVAGLVVGVFACAVCDLVAVGFGIASEGLSAFQTGEDVGKGDWTAALIDGAATVMGAGGVLTDFSAALREGGEGTHVAVDAMAAVLKTFGRSIDIGALLAGGYGNYTAANPKEVSLFGGASTAC